MYGIIDFEEKLKNISDEELAPHLSPELARIPWQQERDEFLPKPFRNQKFVYKGDYLSDRLITQQERAQDYLKKLQVIIPLRFFLLIHVEQVSNSFKHFKYCHFQTRRYLILYFSFILKYFPF